MCFQGKVVHFSLKNYTPRNESVKTILSYRGRVPGVSVGLNEGVSLSVLKFILNFKDSVSKKIRFTFKLCKYYNHVSYVFM